MRASRKRTKVQPLGKGEITPIAEGVEIKSKGKDIVLVVGEAITAKASAMGALPIQAYRTSSTEQCYYDKTPLALAKKSWASSCLTIECHRVDKSTSI